jgi:hypothetical protein
VAANQLRRRFSNCSTGRSSQRAEIGVDSEAITHEVALHHATHAANIVGLATGLLARAGEAHLAALECCETSFHGKPPCFCIEPHIEILGRGCGNPVRKLDTVGVIEFLATLLADADHENAVGLVRRRMAVFCIEVQDQYVALMFRVDKGFDAGGKTVFDQRVDVCL